MFNRLLKLHTQKFSLLATTLLVLLALTLLANTAQAQACANWNTREFFEKALPIDVAHCLERGADAAARDWLGNTPLHYAAEYSENPEIIITLLDRGADVAARSEVGFLTPLHVAAEYSENPEIIITLLERGADVAARDTHGNTPLHFAAGNNENPAIIITLLEHGADVMARQKYGYTPLHDGAEFNKTQKSSSPFLSAVPMWRHGMTMATPHCIARQWVKRIFLISSAPQVTGWRRRTRRTLQSSSPFLSAVPMWRHGMAIATLHCIMRQRVRPTQSSSPCLSTARTPKSKIMMARRP